MKPKTHIGGSLPRMVRSIMPTFTHISGPNKVWKPMFPRYRKGDDHYRNYIEAEWNWRGRGHWFVIWLPF